MTLCTLRVGCCMNCRSATPLRAVHSSTFTPLGRPITAKMAPAAAQLVSSAALGQHYLPAAAHCMCSCLSSLRPAHKAACTVCSATGAGCSKYSEQLSHQSQCEQLQLESLVQDQQNKRVWFKTPTHTVRLPVCPVPQSSLPATGHLAAVCGTQVGMCLQKRPDSVAVLAPATQLHLAAPRVAEQGLEPGASWHGTLGVLARPCVHQQPVGLLCTFEAAAAISCCCQSWA